MTTLTLIGYGFTAAVTFSCVRHLATGGLKEDLEVFKDRTVKDWVEMIVGGLIVLAPINYLVTIADHMPNYLTYSWLQNAAGKGEHVQGSNQMLAGATIPYFGPFFIILLILNLPQLAAAEEEWFRYGTKSWLDAIPRSLAFGLMHLIVGVPVWVGLALAIPGMWFTQQFFKGGVSRSTMAHTIYNAMLAIGLLGWVLYDYLPHSVHTK